MFKALIEALLQVAGLHAIVGGLFAVAFQAAGLKRVDHGTHDAGWFFRLLITPAMIVLWPLLAVKWLRTIRGGVFQGEADRPVSASRIRALHSLGWKLLAVVVPLLIAAALYWRPPAETTTSKLQVPSKIQYPVARRSLTAPAGLRFGAGRFLGGWNLNLGILR